MDSFMVSLALMALSHFLDSDRTKVAAWATKHGDTGARLLDVYDFVEAYTGAKSDQTTKTVSLSGASVTIAPLTK